VLEGRTVGELISEAIRAYLARRTAKKGGAHSGRTPFRRGTNTSALRSTPSFMARNDDRSGFEFLIAFHNERDAHHPAASILMGRSLNGEWGRGLLLDYVFLEVATVLLVRRNLDVSIRVGNCYSKPTSWSLCPVRICSTRCSRSSPGRQVHV
jgi:hypothetical protein